MPVVGLDHLFRVKGRQAVGQRHQRRDRHREVVTIRLDEVMTCDRRRINVVLAKRPNKCLQVIELTWRRVFSIHMKIKPAVVTHAWSLDCYLP